jgi:hypothetical protein
MSAMAGRAGEGPAGLLDPRRGLVGFTGREHELGGLLAWCEDGAPRGVRLVTGPGGVGKTRLSVELCARLGPAGWQCVWVADGAEAAALVVVVRRGQAGRVLLVVDYAETRIGLGELLGAVAVDGGPVRALLVARSAGEWWDRLGGGEPAVQELLAGAGSGEPLPVAVSGELSNAELVAAAVPVFAAALGVAAPSSVVVEPPGAVPVLDLHAAALVAVLRSAGTGGPARVQVADVLAELLDHEERFWRGSAERLGLLAGAAGMTPGMLRQVVAAGALLGAGSQDQAVQLLGRVPGVAASVQLARWLRDLYPPQAGPPGGDAEWLGALSPDRLAEHLVVAELSASAELAGRCLTGLDERQALRAVTLLGRAAADQREAAGVLLERVLPLLERVVAGLPDDVGLLTAIANAIPYPSAALAEADLAITRRILAVLPDGDRGLRAWWLSWLGVTLSQTGHRAEALPPTQEAVAIRRELAEASPGRYWPGLAASLFKLGNRFLELGRLAEALAAEQEALAAYRELVEDYPGRYRPGLAASLSNLGVIFSELGRPAEALAAGQEAVAAYRELVEAYSDRYRPELARSLSNLGVDFWELGRPAEALPPAQEAVAVNRELVEAYPDRYRPDLAASLSALGFTVSELGRLAEALAAEQEALAAYRELAVAYPDRYRPDLARSLSNLGNRFSELGRAAEALPPTQEAVAIRRELAEAYPDRYRPGVAASLSNLGVCFYELGRAAEALAPTQEAVAIYRELAAAYPDRYRPKLATSLYDLGIWFSKLRRPAEALPSAQEAVAIYRELTAAYPDRYRPDLARSLQVLAIALHGLGRWAEARATRREADHNGGGTVRFPRLRRRLGLRHRNPNSPR